MRNKGFTLLELVTVISIISILIATGVPSFVSYQRHNSIRIAAQDIKSFLVEARTLSLNPRPEDKGKQYYYVEIGSLSISLKVNDTAESIKGPIEFGNDVQVDQEGWGTYKFNIPSGDPDFGGADPTKNATIILKFKNEQESEKRFKQTIVADGIGGDVKITEGVNE